MNTCKPAGRASATMQKLIFVFATSLSICCRSADPRGPSVDGIKESLDPDSKAQAPLIGDSPANQAKIDEQVSYLRNDIAKQSREYGIDTLGQSAPVQGFETRIWHGFGLTLPHCLIIRKTNDQWSATFVAPARNGYVQTGPKTKLVIEKRQLTEARSGWNQLEMFLRKSGVDAPIGLRFDEHQIAVPDGQSIIIESKAQSTYSVVGYSEYSESHDGKQAMDVCRRLEQEFYVYLGCHPFESAP